MNMQRKVRSSPPVRLPRVGHPVPCWSTAGPAPHNVYGADEITVSAPNERVDLEALKATKARRKGADTVISSAHWQARYTDYSLDIEGRIPAVHFAGSTLLAMPNPCKLCQLPEPLVRSHLIPSAAYKPCLDSANTFIKVTSKFVMHTSRELQDLLPCKDCEKSLNDGGESWLLPKLAKIDGTFPMLDILESGPPSYSSDGNIFYEATKNSEIPVDKITHFAMGVFWKASAHSWSGTEREPLIQLVPYADSLNR
jgi:hypothetical protein